jgi:hypothetical protein
MTETLQTPVSNRTATSSGFKRFLLLTGSAFVVGIAAMGWAVSQWQPARSLFIKDAGSSGGIETAPGVPDIQVQPAPPAGQVLPPADLANTTGRNEGLLVALAARRAVDSGQSLGSLETLLRIRFADRHPAAVATILQAARQPLTLETLSADLKAVAPILASGGPNASFLDKAKRNFSQLIVVRKKDEPSPAPAEAMGHIARLVESGRVELALTEASRLPGAAAAAKWLEAARRYVETRRAFDLIERSAIVMPATSPVPPVIPALPPVIIPPAEGNVIPNSNGAASAPDLPLAPDAT